jgi:peptidoglycan/LPS O-acetylase OafA/YrhL
MAPHFRILGFWRVAAALLVMVFHYLLEGPSDGHAAAARMRALMPLLDMFMMISGFLIMYRYAERLLVERGGYKRFVVRRLARFYPLYLATLVYFVLLGLGHLAMGVSSGVNERYDWSTLPASILLVQGWGFTDALTFNYVAWTLSAEWFCYLTLPLVVLAHRRYGIAGLAALVLASCATLEAMVAAGVMPFETWMAADTWGAYRAFADFSIGALLAMLVRDCRWKLTSTLPGWTLFGLTCISMWNGLGGYPALALLAASTFLAALAERNDQHATRLLKPFDAVANASFSIYLIHPVLGSLFLGIVWHRFLAPLDIVDFYVFWLVPMASTLVLALLSVRCFETPVAKWLNDRFAAFSSRETPARNAATAARLPQ